MNIHARFPPSTRSRRTLSVQQAVEWAFRTEKVLLELPEPPGPERGETYGFGLEYVLIQRAALGCRIDSGRFKPDSSAHEDAEVIAACVANLPSALGGLRMAIRIAELARAGTTPDWMPGAAPRCVPIEMKRNQHGERSITIPVGTARVLSRGKWRTVEIRACPVTFSPHPDQIEAAHRHYHQWWEALDWVREGLREGGMLREISVTEAMTKREPWR